MYKRSLLGISIAIACLILFASISNVVGIQTVQSSKKDTITHDTIDQKELLFQTIIEIANNEKIQAIIFKSTMDTEKLLNQDAKFSLANTPKLTKNQLEHMYFFGVMLSKIISKSKIHSMAEQYQLINKDVQNEITTVVDKDAELKGKITQLSNVNCDCENTSTTRLWNFPVICSFLFPIFIISAIISIITHEAFFFVEILAYLGTLLDCFWVVWFTLAHY